MAKWPIIWILFILLTLLDKTDSALHCDPEHGFQCKSGQCISKQQRCDHVEDCKDKSDEEGCDYPKCNSSIHFICANMKCIHASWKCDGTDDCRDNSDEAPATCANHTCHENEFHCHHSKSCLPKTYKCDGDVDCDGGEDEEDCAESECESNEFKCVDKHKCIPLSYKCDGELDCDDGSDEVSCTNMICKDDEFACASKTQCLPEFWKCDDISDCKDESDEQNCTSVPRKCPSNYFACVSGSIPCIPLTWKCDGNTECSDGSDELHCNNIKSRCPYGETLCANRRQCISKKKVCDGNRDCIDKSDESDCGDKRLTSDCPHETHFKCPGDNDKCIPEHRLCDDYDDCPGSEDEVQGPHFCKYDECQVANGNCSHECVNLRLGYKCECPNGYELGKDKRTCGDIDECHLPFVPCDHICFNTNGSYKCACFEGFTLMHGRDCKPTPSKKIVLIAGNRNKIEKFVVDRGNSPGQVLIKDIYVKSLAIDIANDFVYWADTRNETISRSKISDPEHSEVILDKKTVRTPQSLAIDWVNGLLFWADIDYDTVSVSKLDGSSPRTLFAATKSMVMSIAVHPIYGYIYLGYAIQSGNDSGMIERCGMDGDLSSCIEIVNDQISYPTDMAIDFDQDLLYWVDHFLRILSVSDLDGKNRRIVTMETHKPFSVAVFAGRVYITDSQHHMLIRTNRTGGDMKVIKTKLSAEMDVVVADPKSQKPGTSYCEPCEFLCLPRAKSDDKNATKYSCACPDHYIMKEKKCISTTTSPSTSAETSPVTTAKYHSPANVTSTGTGSTGLSTGSQVVLAIGILAIIALLVVIVWSVIRWRRQRSARKSMNFNNPIYKKVNESIASSSSFPGLSDPSTSTSAGDIAIDDRDGTTALILNEEVPDGSNPDLPSGSGVKFTTGGLYTKVPNGDTTIDYPGKLSVTRS